jgi:hypothetical protein
VAKHEALISPERQRLHDVLRSCVTSHPRHRAKISDWTGNCSTPYLNWVRGKMVLCSVEQLPEFLGVQTTVAARKLFKNSQLEIAMFPLA